MTTDRHQSNGFQPGSNHDSGRHRASILDVKNAGRGRWASDILPAFGFAAESLTTRHGPCPKCGGTDRFRALDDVEETGAVYCNQCFSKGNGDGIAAVQWLNDWTIPQTLEAIANHLGLGSHRPQSRPVASKPVAKAVKAPATLYPTAQDGVDVLASRLGKPVGVHLYCDLSGNEYSRICRFEPKTFRPVSKFPGGWGLAGPEYRLPYRANLLHSAQLVYVVEGEGVADSLAALGLNSTTSMNGAKSEQKTDWSPLAGKTVVILPDNDEPGREYARNVSEILRALGCIVKIVTLSGLREKGDFVDWLETFGEAAEPADIVAELNRLVDAAPVEGEPVSRLKFRSAVDLMREFPELRHELIGGLLRIGETMNVIAASKTGKSWLMLLLAFSIACGLKWLGAFWCKRGNVLYVDNELHPETLSHRLNKVAEFLGVNEADYADNFTCVNLRGELQDLNFLAAELLKAKPGEFSVIILDAWYRLQPSGSDENSNGDVTKLYNLLDAVAARLGAAFVCVHHSSKGNQSGKSVTDVGSGAGAQSRAADTHLVLRPHEEDGAIVVDAALRSFKPIDPFVLRRDGIAYVMADDLDPKALKSDRPKRKESDQSGPTREDIQRQKHQEQIDRALTAFRFYPDGETETKLREKAGMSGATFGPILVDLIKSGNVETCSVIKGSAKNPAKYPGYRLTENRGSDTSDTSDTSDKSGVLSRQSGGTRTGAPPLGGTVLSDPPAGREGRTELSDCPTSTVDFENVEKALGGRPA